MKTAAYTICKNEKNKLENWFKYTSCFDYRVILDTGSGDGTWNLLKAIATEDPNTIVGQRRFDVFDFSEARNINLSMIPEDVDWCLSPDMDEWFSVNVLDEMQRIIDKNPTITNIATTRLDIYSPEVFVGPPYQIPTNKIHKRHSYKWVGPVYEHLWPLDINNQKEFYSDKIFLIHDQDTRKPRSDLYEEIMERTYQKDPTDCWNNWFLLSHYYRSKNLHKYLPVALNFLKYNVNRDSKYHEVEEDVKNIYNFMKDNNIIKEIFEGFGYETNKQF